ncbi:MAG: signal transduction histidine kinase [Bacteriovoracaceae bacterium]|jgi:signal transduction histidine kinase
MEDQGNSRTKKIQREDISSNDGPLFDGPSFNSSTFPEDQYFSFSASNNNHLTLPSIPVNKQIVQRLNNPSSKKEVLTSDSEIKIQRSLFSFNKSLDRLNSIFIKKESDLKQTLLRKSTIDQLHSELYSWHTLLRNLINMPTFSGFEICQVLSHEKGTTNVFSYTFGTDKQLVEEKSEISAFNQVFTQIKKSKSSQFSQTSLSIPEFNFVGSFLASTHQLKTHNIIFLLSENSFFPISDSNIEEVKLITPQIERVIENVILKDLSDSKVSNLFRLFEVLTIPISIQNSFGSSIFQNDSFTSYSRQETQGSINTFEAKISDGFKMIMILNSELTKSDVQHFQRVGLLGELLNTLQHELSNPLFGIQLATDFLSMQAEDESVKESLGEISEYCKRCQNILRDFKFIYQGGDKILEVSLKKIIKETLTLTKSASRGITRNLQINTNIDRLNTNPTWLSQIIFNLIINSSQAINSTGIDDGSGKIEILVENKDENFLMITVSDNGPGINKELEASIFDPFYTTKEKGTGLGLAICQSLAQKLEGTMSYKKSTNGGASFSLLLPINEIPNR